MQTGTTADSSQIHLSEMADSALNPSLDAFQIANWVVDPALNQLRHQLSGDSRHLEPRLVKLLSHLARHQGKVVERDSLVELLWPKVIVNENSLTRAVSELRKQLSSTSDPKTTFIETIPKRGYRLAVPVTAISESYESYESSAAMTQQTTDSASLFSFMQRLQKSGTAAFTLTLVLTALLHIDSRPQQAEPLRFTDEVISAGKMGPVGGELLLSESGNDDRLGTDMSKVLFSRDESQFAFVQYDHTGSTIMLGDVEMLDNEASISEGSSGYQPAALYNSEEVLFNLAWSPVGNALLFASKPAMTTAAWFEPRAKSRATLYSLDLNTLEVSLLIQQSPAEIKARGTEMSLT